MVTFGRASLHAWMDSKSRSEPRDAQCRDSLFDSTSAPSRRGRSIGDHHDPLIPAGILRLAVDFLLGGRVAPPCSISISRSYRNSVFRKQRASAYLVYALKRRFPPLPPGPARPCRSPPSLPFSRITPNWKRPCSTAQPKIMSAYSSSVGSVR